MRIRLAFEDEVDEQYAVEDDSIDLEPALRDAVILQLPFQPVCRDTCQGLCADCGARLEDDPGHHHEVLDPRWSTLHCSVQIPKTKLLLLEIVR